MKIWTITISLLIVITAVVLVIMLRYRNAAAPSIRQSNTTEIRYLALGDSYTIGHNVAENERWPNQLTARLRADGIDIGLVGNPSVTGYTTQNLIDRELPLLKTTDPNFVSILIGVNDYVQGVPAKTFERNVRRIIDTVLKSVPKERIVVVTIPDYALTPTGARYGDTAMASAAIKSFNTFMVNEAKQRGILSVDVFPISQRVATDSSLTTDDGLHPSGAQYRLWVEAIYRALIDAKTFSK